jgi:multicomponent Na+:H+ antiporter subunit F
VSPFLIGALLVVAGMIAVGLFRVWAGPTVFDRLVAVALLSVNGVVVLVLLGFTFERPVLFLDIALGFALLAFLLPIALGRYFEERDDGTSTDGLPSPSSRPRPKGIVPHGLYADRGRKAAEAARRRPAIDREADGAPGYPGPVADTRPGTEADDDAGARSAGDDPEVGR